MRTELQRVWKEAIETYSEFTLILPDLTEGKHKIPSHYSLPAGQASNTDLLNTKDTCKISCLIREANNNTVLIRMKKKNLTSN